MLKYFFKIVLLAIIVTSGLYAQTDVSVFTGKVTDENGAPLAYASVVLKENNSGSTTDKKGVFKVMARQGSYTVEVSFLGYSKKTDKVTLRKGETVTRDYSLTSTSFEIGGIQVVADNQFIPLTPETKTKVTSADLEHMQASSLNDVLTLTPGVETTNPDLSGVQTATIRRGDGLGTQVVLDGVPQTNNANMQTGIDKSAQTGIDLRAIPADNIKEVEVIRGIPSVKYGDLTDGLLVVKTKTVADPFRVKYKYNQMLNEFNFSGGIPIGNSWVLNGNLNIATSERDVRVEGDGYTRFAGQISAEKETEEYTLKNILYATRALDEVKVKASDAALKASSNKDVNIKYTGNYAYRFSSFSSLNADISVSYTKQDSYDQSVVARDNTVITDRMTEGSQIGDIVFGSYLGKRWIKGDVWNLYANSSCDFRFFTGSFLNSMSTGITWRDDFNKGQGVVFDPLYPPYLSSDGNPRLRTYDELPQYNIVSLYAEDKITGNFIKPFTLQFGARYETYRPEKINFKGLFGSGDFIESHNGSFLNPRINLSVNLAEKTQLRFGYGVTSKSPPMSIIFAQNKYYDVVDTVSVVNPSYPDSNYSAISTYIRNSGNENLKGYTQKKYEISLDQQIGSMGFSLTGFINNSDDMFEAVSMPITYYKKSFPNPNDLTTYNIKDTTITTYSQYANIGWQKVRGIEFSFKTERIPVINTVFNFDAAYTYDENGYNGGTEYGISKYSNKLGLDVIPFYNPTKVKFTKNLLLNYRFEIQVKSLGIWATLHIQQKLLNISGRPNYGDTLAIGYYTSQSNIVNIPQEQRASEKYSELRRSIQSFELNDLDKPNTFLVNLKVTKSLWQGAVVSFYVNNLFNYRPLYKDPRTSPTSPTYERLNPAIFYGIEFGASLGDIF